VLVIPRRVVQGPAARAHPPADRARADRARVDRALADRALADRALALPPLEKPWSSAVRDWLPGRDLEPDRR
jgi:hypothetical protein